MNLKALYDNIIIQFFDNSIEEKGKTIHCWKCGNKFLSLCHYRNNMSMYDIYCKECEKL